jgi:hypothetical protein
MFYDDQDRKKYLAEFVVLKESFAFRIVLLGFPHGAAITDSILWGGLSRPKSGHRPAGGLSSGARLRSVS